jgi:cell division inhibitor SepF
VSRQEQYEEYEPSRGLWSRVKDRVFGADEAEYEEVADGHAPPQEARRRAAIRLESSRGIRVAVRLNATAFNDARIAADGLKGGQQQIVNLEKATPQMAERIIDFLNGVTYALDGYVEKVAEKVYLFAPANVQVEIDGGAEPQ